MRVTPVIPHKISCVAARGLLKQTRIPFSRDDPNWNTVVVAAPLGSMYDDLTVRATCHGKAARECRVRVGHVSVAEHLSALPRPPRGALYVLAIPPKTGTASEP